MSDLHQPEDVAAYNESSLKALVRSLTLSQGNFKLILARCNYDALRERMVQRLRELSPVEIRELVLPKLVKSLYCTIKAELGDEQPQALMVLGLESVSDIKTVLKSSNYIREEFSKNFPFPLMLWVNDEVLQKLLRLAPDLASWATSIEFAIATDELIEFLQQEADSLFSQVLEAGADQFVDNAALNLGMGAGKRFELESALNELQSRGCHEPALEASQQFILGRDAYANNQMERAQELYKQSLDFWQQNQDLERQACLLFHMGLWWRRYAVLHRAEYKRSCGQARDYYQQCLEILQQANRPELAAKFINSLAEALQQLQQWDKLETVAYEAIKLHLEQWNELKTVAYEAIKLHNIYPSSLGYRNFLRLARAYGFLAEIALAQKKWEQAQKWAEAALDQLSKSVDNSQVRDTDLSWARQLYRSLFRLLLAQAQRWLGQISQALNNLETAKVECKHKYNPQLYLRILEALRSLYFEQGRYREAFEIKQEKRSIEQQYGFQAFIGAGRLQPQQQVINPALVPVGSAQLYSSATGSELNQGTIAPEIVASGRQQDVERLIERITQDEQKLIVIHGPSGVGKSSLLRAGLVPELHQKGSINGRNPLPIVIQYYEDWVRELGTALEKALREVKDIRLSATPDSVEAIVEQLQKNVERNLLTVLIFDQFESFFFHLPSLEHRRTFWQFLHECLDLVNLPYVKVILSLREDYLHYLLECDRVTNLEVTKNDILNKKNRYYLGNFSLEDTRQFIESLTHSFFDLEPALIDKLVQDLAGDLGEVRPIELQLVGAQLQAEEIIRLEQYQQGGLKKALVKRFLEEVVKDCGPENERAAELVLYFLTNEDGFRPRKTRNDLKADFEAADLSSELEKLDLVLEVIVGSGLVFQWTQATTYYYQLVHDYLVSFFRTQQAARLVAEAKQEKEQRKLSEEKLKRVLLKRRLDRLRIVGAGLAIVAALAVMWARQAESQRQIAQKAEMDALNSESENFFLKDDQLRALVASIKATAKLQNTEVLPDINIKTRTQVNLQQAVYGVQERNRIEGHDDWIYGVSFSSDGKMIASVSRDKTVKLWNWDGSLFKTLEGHEKGVSSVSFSPDDKTIASASWDKTIKLWSRDGKLLNTLKGHEGGVHSVSISPDSQTIASSSWDKTVRLWSRDGTLIKTLKGHSEEVYSINFSPDGQTIASASFDKTVRLWSKDGKLLKTLTGHDDKVYSVSFSPDGKTIASASWDKTIKLWSRDGKLLKTLIGHRDRVFDVSFSPDGKTIASASWDKTIKLWSQDGELLKTLIGHSNRVVVARFSPDGKTIASASWDKTVRLWSRDSSYSSLLSILQGHEGEVSSVSFSPDGKTIASASFDKTVKLWNSDGNLLKTLEGHSDTVFGVSFSPDGQTIATASWDRTIKLWSKDGKLLKTLRGHSDRVFSVSFSPNGQTIASTSADKTVILWSKDGTLLKTLRGHNQIRHKDNVVKVSFSPDGQTIASASDDHTAILWNLDGTPLKHLTKHTDEVNGVSFSPDGKTIATASDDNRVRLWKRDGTYHQTLEGHGERVLSVSFSPNGKTIATASFDKTVKLWNRNGKLLSTLTGSEDFVLDASFSPDGKTLASASSDKTVRLWRVEITSQQRLDLNALLQRGCNWVRDYLKNNRNVSESDRHLCDDIPTQK
jgi:WD40 repeat protein